MQVVAGNAQSVHLSILSDSLAQNGLERLKLHADELHRTRHSYGKSHRARPVPVDPQRHGRSFKAHQEQVVCERRLKVGCSRCPTGR